MSSVHNVDNFYTGEGWRYRNTRRRPSIIDVVDKDQAVNTCQVFEPKIVAESVWIHIHIKAIFAVFPRPFQCPLSRVEHALLGLRQSGAMPLRCADPIRDLALLQEARQIAASLVDSEQIELPQFQPLKEIVLNRFSGLLDLPPAG